jgi:Glu-tRNA(Gln) amidotransferase subunit E-like FAD-binding protein
MSCKLTYKGNRYDTLKELVDSEGLANSFNNILKKKYSPIKNIDNVVFDKVLNSLSSLTKNEVESVLIDTRKANLSQAVNAIIVEPSIINSLSNKHIKDMVSNIINKRTSLVSLDNIMVEISNVDNFGTKVERLDDSSREFFDSCSM